MASSDMKQSLMKDSPRIAELLTANDDSENVKLLRSYIERLQDYATIMEELAAQYKTKTDHHHHNLGQKVQAEVYDFQPVYDNRQINTLEKEVLMPRETVFYRLSATKRINAAQIGMIDGSKVMVQSVWIELTDNELTRLIELINSDY